MGSQGDAGQSEESDLGRNPDGLCQHFTAPHSQQHLSAEPGQWVLILWSSPCCVTEVHFLHRSYLDLPQTRCFFIFI